MKKILFILLLLFPFMVRAVENVKITNIEQLDKSDTVTVNTEPTFEGLKINFDFKFTTVNDFVKYKVTIKNEDDKEYEIESGVQFNEGEFIKYEFGMNGESAIIKPNETKDMTLLITYVKEPDPDKFVDGKYVEQNAMSIDLSTKEEQHSAVDPASQQKKEDNPKTGAKGIIILIAVLLGVLLLICFIEKKNAFFLIALFLLIPITINAIEKITLEIETKVEIEASEKLFKISYIPCLSSRIYEYEFPYLNGMTWEEYFDSDYYTEARNKYTEEEMSQDYYNNRFYINAFEYNEYQTCLDGVGAEPEFDENKTEEENNAIHDAYLAKINKCSNDYHKTINGDSVIISKSNGTYRYERECEV